MTNWKNNFWLGLPIGLVGPFIGVFIYGLGWSFYHHLTLSYFLHDIAWGHAGFRAPVLSLGIIFDLLPFYFFIQKNQNKSARGVLTAVFLFVPLVIYLKFSA